MKSIKRIDLDCGSGSSAYLENQMHLEFLKSIRWELQSNRGQNARGFHEFYEISRFFLNNVKTVDILLSQVRFWSMNTCFEEYVCQISEQTDEYSQSFKIRFSIDRVP